MITESTQRKVKDSKRQKRCGWFTVLKLIFAGLPTIAFGVFTIIFSLHQESSSKAMRDQDQRQADENNRRILFKEYIDDMKQFLVDESFDDKMSKTLLHMRVQTLYVLKYLDARRKYDVIMYLYENGLLRHDQTPTLNLRGADLTGIEFVQSSTSSCDLSFLYLPGIYGENLIFDHCHLKDAIFDNAHLVNAQFRSCDLSDVRFTYANLTRAKFIDNTLYQTKFQGASLVQSLIHRGVLVKVTFANTDLYQCDINDQLLFGVNTDGSPLVFISNTRLPNGSFSSINVALLINNQNSKYQCPSNAMIGRSDHTKSSNCVFLAGKLQFDSFDTSLQEISLLIDHSQAKFNLSTLLRLNYTYTNEDIAMIIVFKERFEPVNGQHFSLSIKPDSLSNFYSFSGIIPPKTRFLSVRLVCEMEITSNQYCQFDQIVVSIVGREK